MSNAIRNVVLILLVLHSFTITAQVSIGTKVPQAKFQVHDSTTTSTLLMSSGSNVEDGFFINFDLLQNSQIFNSAGHLSIKGGTPGSIGGEVNIFQTGNVGIGKGIGAALATNELTVLGNNPVRLIGLNNIETSDTVLVKNPNGVIFKRSFSNLYSDASFWTKTNNFLVNTTDSIGIGTVTPIAPLQVKSADPLDVVLTSDDEKSELHLQANGIESVIGQYDLSTSATFFSGTLPAKGLSYFQGNFESISIGITEGMLFNVQNERPIYFGTADAERMRIGGMGNINVGAFDASQTKLFNVNGKSYFADSLQVGDKFTGLHNNAGQLNVRGFTNLNLIAGQPFALNIQSHETGSPFAIFDMEKENLTVGTTVGEEKLNVQGNAIIEDSLYVGNSDYRLFLNEDTLTLESSKHMKFRTDFIGDFSFFNRDSTFVHFDGSRASVGIGIQNAIQELEVNGDVLIYDTLYIGNRFNKIYTGANMHIDALTNLNLNTRSNYDVHIRSAGIKYAVFEGTDQRFGVGTTSPEEKVDVIGTIKADKFKMITSPNNGYVMTSDADGLASWQEVPNDGDWTLSGSDIYAGTAGTVTIGTAGLPTAKLNVKGSISMPIFRTTVLNYSTTINDYTVIMDTPGSSITLPDPGTSLGRIYVLKFRNSVPGSIQSMGSGAKVEGMASFPVPSSPIGGIYTTIVVQSDGILGWWVINY